ncbi:MAG: protein translocase subunit SecD [Micropepsaceae bacterium]
MLQIQRWKIVMILAICALGVLTALPNFLPQDFRKGIQSVSKLIPNKPITFGLDLQGGVYVLFEAQIEVAVKDRMQDLLDEIRKGLRKEKITYGGLTASKDSVKVQISDMARLEDARSFLKKLSHPITGGVSGVSASDYDVSMDDAGLATVSITTAGVEQIRANAMAQSQEILRKRIDPDGTKEMTIQPQGTRRIIVQLPGASDPQAIIEKGQATAKLTFHMVDDTVSQADIDANRIPPGSKKYMEKRGRGPNAQEFPIVVKERAVITGDMLSKAQGTFSGQTSLPIIAFEFNAQGARRFADITRNNVGKRFAAILDDKVITAPTIRGPILGGSGIIEGDFTIDEANETAVLLNSGALVVPLRAEDQRTVGAELGKEAVQSGSYAALFGLILVVSFMALQYRLFGVFADISLLANLLLLLGLMTAIGATLTLPGIAAFVLTMGMAVDANVLIYERIREEQRNGKTIMSAIDSGFSRAMATIMDANATHALAGLILLAVGSGPVRGFAVALVLGILTSFFSSIFVTRLQVYFWLNAKRRTVLSI